MYLKSVQFSNRRVNRKALLTICAIYTHSVAFSFCLMPAHLALSSMVLRIDLQFSNDLYHIYPYHLLQFACRPREMAILQGQMIEPYTQLSPTGPPFQLVPQSDETTGEDESLE
ncbi:hypothetical protein J6590_096410 [Homalodisca vitripennis]|nr:hypothetical protein J6590_096410 [Homalodisca vitripennis]